MDGPAVTVMGWTGWGVRLTETKGEIWTRGGGRLLTSMLAPHTPLKLREEGPDVHWRA